MGTETTMLKSFTLILTALVLVQGAPGEVKYTLPILEGPYQQYGVQPLTELNGNYYFFAGDVSANWYAAELFCVGLGLRLVSIETEEENTALFQHIETTYGSTKNLWWTSGNDLADRWTWMWFTTAEPFIYTQWRTGEPNNAGGNDSERAVVLDTNQGTKGPGWVDISPYDAKIIHPLCELVV